MTKHLIVVTALCLLLLLALPAEAQTTTPPAPTALPGTYYSTAPLSSGGTLLIERRVTFGDLFVGFSALLVSVVIGVSALPGMATRLFKR